MIANVFWIIYDDNFTRVGAMTGGGSKVSRKRMGSSVVHDVTPEQLKAMEEKLEEQTKRLEVLMYLPFDFT